jgi:Flp pilus assembly pilin Flp
MQTLSRTLTVFAARIGSQGGQTMAEYGILITVIAIVVVAAAIILGGNVSGLFTASAHHV